MRQNIINLALFFIVGMCSCAHYKPEPYCNFLQNEYGENVSWYQEDLPVYFKIHKSVPMEWVVPIGNAAHTWNKIFGKTVIVLKAWDFGPEISRNDGVNVIYAPKIWPKENEDKLAITKMWWAGNRLIETDIVFNVEFYDFSSDGSSFDIESLALHEFGHVLGLDHDTNTEKTMYKNLQSGIFKRELSWYEVEILSCEYDLN